MLGSNHSCQREGRFPEPKRAYTRFRPAFLLRKRGRTSITGDSGAVYEENTIFVVCKWHIAIFGFCMMMLLGDIRLDGLYYPSVSLHIHSMANPPNCIQSKTALDHCPDSKTLWNTLQCTPSTLFFHQQAS
uniref:Uncharacterized protein n=1 Tax=Rhodosorus marinus TaxID=101924 RepID=A0A7S2Z9M0_9RHOD